MPKYKSVKPTREERKAKKALKKVEREARKKLKAATRGRTSKKPLGTEPGAGGVTKPKKNKEKYNKNKERNKALAAEKALKLAEKDTRKDKEKHDKLKSSEEEETEDVNEEEEDEAEESSEDQNQEEEEDEKDEEPPNEEKSQRMDEDKVNDIKVEEPAKATTANTSKPIGALVPFANPLADEKVGKKVFKVVKKAASQYNLKRGVKEVVKALRKSTTSSSSTGSNSTSPIGVVVLAADISPLDVISHIPVLCEDHDIPYIYVTSRAELGSASQTKRPTSVVMVSRDHNKKKAKNPVVNGDDAGAGSKTETADAAAEWDETFRSLVKVVERESRHVLK